MLKKSSSTTPSKKAEKKEQEEEPVMEQKKQYSTPKKPGNEIDEIFASKKRKKPEQKQKQKPNGDEISKPKSMKTTKNKDKKSKKTKEEGLNDASSRPRKRSADGLAIYTEEELGINKSDAGNTSLCPFDCDCCF